MSDPRNEMHAVGSLTAEAIGEPGNRTFRIIAGGGSGSAMIWLEKEQLAQLAMAMQQIASSLEDAGGREANPPREHEVRPLTNVELKARKLALGYHERRAMYIIDAHEADEDTADVRLWTDSSQAESFAEDALRVCASGRPICPLCNIPIDADGHTCPKMNGQIKALNLRE
jgi:uncharacterized repeat protein (TIGR03847 family)